MRLRHRSNAGTFVPDSTLLTYAARLANGSAWIVQLKRMTGTNKGVIVPTVAVALVVE